MKTKEQNNTETQSLDGLIEAITPLPWMARKVPSNPDMEPFGFMIENNTLEKPNAWHVAAITDINREFTADAKYIVHACNVLPELVEALESAIKTLDDAGAKTTLNKRYAVMAAVLRNKADSLKPVLNKAKQI